MNAKFLPSVMEESRKRNLRITFVSGLIDFDDVSYDDHSELLYELARKVVVHFQSYLDEVDTRKVSTMLSEADRKLSASSNAISVLGKGCRLRSESKQGLHPIKGLCIYRFGFRRIRDFRHAPANKSNMARYVFGGFQRCLYPALKFQSDTERKLAVILDRESLKWFKPANGQFQIFYLDGGEHREYQPDFVAETETVITCLRPSKQIESTTPT